MNTTRILSVSILLAGLVGNAIAEGGLTREQVRAELAEARATGKMIHGESGLWLSQQYPELYPAQPKTSGKTRAEVRAEYEEARRRGELVVGERGLRMNEIAPHLYPQTPRAPGKTRQDVMAELAEARLLGDLQVGESGRTQAETYPQRYAAVRAQRAAQAQTLAEATATQKAASR
jgi:Domain of unknown function (DUF4148)